MKLGHQLGRNPVPFMAFRRRQLCQIDVSRLFQNFEIIHCHWSSFLIYGIQNFQETNISLYPLYVTNYKLLSSMRQTNICYSMHNCKMCMHYVNINVTRAHSDISPANARWKSLSKWYLSFHTQKRREQFSWHLEDIWVMWIWSMRSTSSTNGKVGRLRTLKGWHLLRSFILLDECSCDHGNQLGVY